MKPSNEIVDRIRKCLNLANGKNATEGEIWNALAKAKEIAMRHGIDMAQIEEKEDTSRPIDIAQDMAQTRSRYQQPYHRYIPHLLREIFEVTVIRNYTSLSGGTLSTFTIIGDASDVAIAKEVFGWLEKVFPASLSKKVSSGQLTYCAADTNGFYLGFYRGILETNRRKEEEVKKEVGTDNANKFALMVVKKEEAIQKWVAEKYPKLKHIKSRSRRFSGYAAAHGLAEGRKLNLRQLDSCNSSGQLK